MEKKGFGQKLPLFFFAVANPTSYEYEGVRLFDIKEFENKRLN